MMLAVIMSTTPSLALLSLSSIIRATPAPRMLALSPGTSAGELLKVSHPIDDVSATAAFYQGLLGLEKTETDCGVLLSAAGGAGLAVELRTLTGAAFEPNSGYLGLTARVPSVEAALLAATASGGTVLSEPMAIEHGPSLVPDEPEDNSNELLEAIVADPSGYPLLLHECADAGEPCLSGARFECRDWKKTQEWCARLMTLRPRDIHAPPPHLAGGRASAGARCAGTPTPTARRRSR